MIPQKYIDRFWSHVDVREPDECWPWKLALRPDGYAQVRIEGRLRYVNRVAWETTEGPIPDEIDVLHTCDNRACCNPGHLFTGTHQDNMADRDQKGRQARGSRNHKAKLVEAQVSEIRARYVPGTVKMADLAAEYGVTGSVISLLINRHIWKHVP